MFDAYTCILRHTMLHGEWWLTVSHSCSSIPQILKHGGVFVCRVYELLTRFSTGLVYTMYRLFTEVCVCVCGLTSQ